MSRQPIEQALQRRIKALKTTSDDEAASDSDEQGLTNSHHESSSATDQSDNDAADSDHNTEDQHTQDDPSTLSFGALARAQETLGKRKRLTTSQASPPPKHARLSPNGSSRPTKTPIPSRTSKHAPTAMSSRRAVTRRREVIAVPKIVPRDPRFDPLTGPLDSNRVAQTYSFLSTYQASEIAQLKTAIRNAKDVAEREKLQKALKRMESRRKSEELKEERQRVLREHRKQEKERVKGGKQPYYLKEGELRTKVLEKRFEGMGSKRAEKVIEKRRKRKAGKEKKLLPERRRAGDR